MSVMKAYYNTQEINVKETLTSNELNTISHMDSNENINSLLLEKIKRKIGNKCNENGYVDRDSIKIISRSMGKINSSHFNGDIVYNLSFRS